MVLLDPTPKPLRWSFAEQVGMENITGDGGFAFVRIGTYGPKVVRSSVG